MLPFVVLAAALLALGVVVGFQFAHWSQISAGGGPRSSAVQEPRWTRKDKGSTAGKAAARQLLPAEGERVLQLSSVVESKLLDPNLPQMEMPVEYMRIDSLTCLPNHFALEEDLGRRLAEFRRGKTTKLSLLLVDIDRFRSLNDTLGRAWGDQILRGAARVLSATLRDMDLVARYHDDMFAAILPSTSAIEASAAAKRVRAELVDATFRINGKQQRITVSVGLAEAAGGDYPTAILERAEAALASAKLNCGNCAYFHTGTTIKAVPAFEPEGLLAKLPSSP